MKSLFLKKIAYTLAEIMFVLAIIGVISAITIHTTRIGQNQYKKLYSVAFNTLVQAVGNAALAWKPASGQCENIQVSNIGGEDGSSSVNINVNTSSTYYYWSRDCWNKYTTKNPSLKSIENMADGGDESGYFTRLYPGFLYGNGYTGQYGKGLIDGRGTDEVFCKALTSQINTVDEQNECKSFISGVSPEVYNDKEKKGRNFLHSFCSLQEGVDDNDAVIRDANGKAKEICAGNQKGTEGIIPSFVTSNGQKFYISTVLYANPPYGEGLNTSGRMPFRFVVVDLNGDSGPNTQLKEGNRMPDIVLFAINSAGKVIPLGWPEFDELYLSASVYYPSFYKTKDDKNNNVYKQNEVYRSDLMTFFDAKMHAWAGSAGGGCTDCYYAQPVVLSEPYSFSNLFYSWGYNCAGEGCASEKTLSSGSGNNSFSYLLSVDSLLANLVWQFIYIDSKKSPEFSDTSKYIPNSFVPTTVKSGTLDTDNGCTPGASPCKIDFAD